MIPRRVPQPSRPTRSRRESRPGSTGCRGPGSTGWSWPASGRPGSWTGSRSRSSGPCGPADRARQRHPMTASDIGTAAAIYVTGACFGALSSASSPTGSAARNSSCSRSALHPRDRRHRAGLDALVLLPVAVLHRRRHRRGVRRDQLGDRRTHPGPHRGRVDLIINGSYWLGSIAGSAAALVFLDTASSRRCRLAAGVPSRGAGAGHPARRPQRAGEPALDVHPRPRGGGRETRRRHRARHRGADRPDLRPARERTHRPAAQVDPVPRDRQGGVQAYPRAPCWASRCSSARRSSTTR